MRGTSGACCGADRLPAGCRLDWLSDDGGSGGGPPGPRALSSCQSPSAPRGSAATWRTASIARAGPAGPAGHSRKAAASALSRSGRPACAVTPPRSPGRNFGPHGARLAHRLAGPPARDEPRPPGRPARIGTHLFVPSGVEPGIEFLKAYSVTGIPPSGQEGGCDGDVAGLLLLLLCCPHSHRRAAGCRWLRPVGQVGGGRPCASAYLRTEDRAGCSRLGQRLVELGHGPAGPAGPALAVATRREPAERPEPGSQAGPDTKQIRN